MKKIFVVSDGEYSDRRNVAAFDDKDMAEEYSKLYGLNDVEELDLNPSLPETPGRPSGMYAYRVVMDTKVGNALSIEQMAWQETDRHDGTVTTFEVHDGNWHKELREYFVWGRDKDHAVKIANEKRIAFMLNSIYGGQIDGIH